MVKKGKFDVLKWGFFHNSFFNMFNFSLIVYFTFFGVDFFFKIMLFFGFLMTLIFIFYFFIFDKFNDDDEEDVVLW